jgi:predicted phage terminase large subunit-like protein
LPLFTQVVQSWDTAFKKGAESSFSVCTTWGVAENGYFLVSVWRGRAEFPELRRMLIELAQEWKPSAILVEDRASVQSLLQELKATSLPVLAVKVDSDKLSRAQAVTPLIEAGKVFLPESAPWLADYIDELAAFPMGNYDDAVDSTTQALNYFRERAVQSILFHRGYTTSIEEEKEMLWENAMRGYPLTEAEIAKL